jgi:hypothetical protein
MKQDLNGIEEEVTENAVQEIIAVEEDVISFSLIQPSIQTFI